MLRHTHATTLLRNGVSIEIVSRRLGHKSIETTKNTYEHLTANDMRVAIEEAMAAQKSTAVNDASEAI